MDTGDKIGILHDGAVGHFPRRMPGAKIIFLIDGEGEITEIIQMFYESPSIPAPDPSLKKRLAEAMLPNSGWSIETLSGKGAVKLFETMMNLVVLQKELQKELPERIRACFREMTAQKAAA